MAGTGWEGLLEGFYGEGASSTVSRFPLSSTHYCYQPVLSSSIHGDRHVCVAALVCVFRSTACINPSLSSSIQPSLSAGTTADKWLGGTPRVRFMAIGMCALLRFGSTAFINPCSIHPLTVPHFIGFGFAFPFVPVSVRCTMRRTCLSSSIQPSPSTQHRQRATQPKIAFIAIVALHFWGDQRVTPGIGPCRVCSVRAFREHQYFLRPTVFSLLIVL